ncbi:prepilin-type N-terminal cleavage/methylation domain-containing protein [Massilia sp. YIM B02763]|uniref:pilus assembly FimT family protein n=1 Tax=Massilia sp. YIM B02763 TaxID=3050130 RepID=UPI0025B6F9E6|nr:GspH/FimT family pseudopilin [Massilia sp. YIM B02763]MDN4051537.1 prepilin-type N-terminal cleavage/methylation domain-containing protein [Massilia sp. YIM B02763]
MRRGGFTLVELITVLLLIGVMAAVAVPRLANRSDGAALSYGDQVVSALRLARATAVAHRRLVCVGAGPDAMVLRMATAPGANVCDAALAGVADDDYRSSADTVVSGGLAGLANGQPRHIYFQPDGTITDAAGAILNGAVTIEVDGFAARTIQLFGATGHVE